LVSAHQTMASPDKGRRRAKTDRSKTDSAQASKSEAEEVAELQELIGRSPAKHYGSTMSGASSSPTARDGMHGRCTIRLGRCVA